MKAKIIILLLTVTCLAGVVAAHQPRLAPSTAPMDNPIIIKKPEISQAFYGQLKGEPVYYMIESPKEFRLYVNILVPDNPGEDQLVYARILDDKGKTIKELGPGDWEPYFEEFGGDHYLKGPEFNETLPGGKYYIMVFNEENKGKYALAVGDIETFPADEALKAIILLPILKATIFNVPVLESFLQFLGIIMAMGAFISLNFTANKNLIKVSWAGIILTTIMWALHYLQNPLNILANIQNIILLVTIILTGKFNKEIIQDKMPTWTSRTLIIFWLIFLFLRVTI
ncbi:MAG: hypothetical protein QMC86_05280 [Methanothermobacter sp.]|nr:hypothetical protein [Methanothermobacter sp.]